MIILTRQERKILHHILKLDRNINNSVYIGGKKGNNVLAKLPDKELIRELIVLEQNNLIKLKWYNVNHGNLDACIEIFILPDGDQYFNMRYKQRIKTGWEIFKWLIPLVISIISLLVSIFKHVS